MKHLHNCLTHPPLLRPLGILVVLALAMLATPAIAAPWDDAAKGVQDILYGPLGTTLAIIGVAAAGITAFAGRLSWGHAGYVMCGIVIFFAAPALVTYMKGKLGTTAAIDTRTWVVAGTESAPRASHVVAFANLLTSPDASSATSLSHRV